MAPNTRNKKKSTSGARASGKKKAHHAKRAPTIDPLKQAAESLTSMLQPQARLKGTTRNARSS